MTDQLIDDQAHAWVEIREWAQEAAAQPLIPTQPGGSWDGPGASLSCTGGLRERLPELLAELGITSLLDIACGDWNWMRLVDLGDIEYTGWDVDPGRIERCEWRIKHGDFGSLSRPNAVFEVVNAVTVPEIPYYDALLMRDFLGHLTNEWISGILRKAIDGGSTWLLASTYPEADNDFVYNPNDFAWAGYMEHPVNLEADPFNLTKRRAIGEDPGPGGVLTHHRELGLFQLNEEL